MSDSNVSSPNAMPFLGKLRLFHLQSCKESPINHGRSRVPAWGPSICFFFTPNPTQPNRTQPTDHPLDRPTNQPTKSITTNQFYFENPNVSSRYFFFVESVVFRTSFCCASCSTCRFNADTSWQQKTQKPVSQTWRKPCPERLGAGALRMVKGSKAVALLRLPGGQMGAF